MRQTLPRLRKRPLRQVWLSLLVLPCLGLLSVVSAQQGGSPVATQHQIQMVEMRLDRLERRIESGALTEMLQGFEQLQSEVRQLRGQLEQAENELRILRNRQRDQLGGLDSRVAQLEGGFTDITRPAPEFEPEPEAEPSPVPGDPLAGAAEQGAYEEAFEALMAGNHDEAIRRLESFVERYPDGIYSANALFWLAEAKYAIGDFEGALYDYAALRERFPESDKAPDALLKRGYAQFELGQFDAARQTLNQVLSDHAGTTLSRLAQDRLRRLDGR